MITIALPTGRLGEETTKILQLAFKDLKQSSSPSRSLIHYSNGHSLRFLLVKPKDVPTYIEHGIADLGVIGKDILLEGNKQLYEVLDLNFGNCQMAIAGLPEKKYSWETKSIIRVATEYPNIARDYFLNRGMAAEIIKLNGSVELAPLVGLSDVIVDIVESGKTLQDNGLIVFAEICKISAKLVVNQASFKTKNKSVTQLIDSIKIALEG